MLLYFHYFHQLSSYVQEFFLKLFKHSFSMNFLECAILLYLACSSKRHFPVACLDEVDNAPWIRVLPALQQKLLAFISFHGSTAVSYLLRALSGPSVIGNFSLLQGII